MTSVKINMAENIRMRKDFEDNPRLGAEREISRKLGVQEQNSNVRKQKFES